MAPRHPSTEEQLILLSAGTAARRQATRERIDELGALADWSVVAELLRARRLLPLLGPRLVELAKGNGEDDFPAIVAEAVDVGRRQGAFLELIEARVRSALADAGIVSAPLKGPRLSEALYGDPGRRASSDIDLLVAPEQLRDATDVVRELGYAAPIDHVDDRGLPLLHFALLHEDGQLPPVELHWRIHWYERDFACDRLLPPSGELADGWRPAPIDELTSLLLFYARDGFIDLRLATDIGAWWDALGAQLQPGALGVMLRAYPALARVLVASARVAERTVGVPARQVIAPGARLGGRGSIAARLANPLPRSSQPQLYADMGLIDGLLAPRGDFGGFIKRQIAPPHEVIWEHAHKAQTSRVPSTLGYSLRVLGRYGLTMTRLLHSQPDRAVK